VGFREMELPFSFEDTSGRLVGYDIELAHALANDLGVRLELVPVTLHETADVLRNGTIDIVMSGVATTPDRALEMEFSDPYLDQTLAFVVLDHRRGEFSSRSAVQSLRGLVVAVPDLPYLRERVAAYLDEPKLVTVDRPQQFFESRDPDWDALVYSAEAGSAWTLLHPEFSVVVPQPDVVRIPIAFPIAPGNESMRIFVNSWIDLKRRDRTLDRLYDHWILGESAEREKPRWSVIRDVLGWVE
jgi:ABC-type amino acid transport substrate-binding protein